MSLRQDHELRFDSKNSSSETFNYNEIQVTNKSGTLGVKGKHPTNLTNDNNNSYNNTNNNNTHMHIYASENSVIIDVNLDRGLSPKYAAPNH